MELIGTSKLGWLAKQSGYRLPVRVLKSAAGYYIGTSDADGPVTRESVQYWAKKEDADKALETGLWTQRTNL